MRIGRVGGACCRSSGSCLAPPRLALVGRGPVREWGCQEGPPAPRLSWGNLIKALAEPGIQVTEDELINTPLTIDVHPEVQADLERR